MVRVVLSVLAALLGVQSEANRQRDFQASSALPFILMGILAIALLIFTLVALVSWVLTP